MIVFDLDGTLANCEHRRHFVDPLYSLPKKSLEIHEYYTDYCRGTPPEKWEPDWKAFYEACDKDEPIQSAIDILEYIGEGKEYGSDTPWVDYDGIEIWTGRSESVRKKTEHWFFKNIRYFNKQNLKLKMRPIGDYTPDDQLKERWLDERINDMGNQLASSHDINFVFDSDPKSIEMWRRRGIFVFNCCQHDEEF